MHAAVAVVATRSRPMLALPFFVTSDIKARPQPLPDLPSDEFIGFAVAEILLDHGRNGDTRRLPRLRPRDHGRRVVAKGVALNWSRPKCGADPCRGREFVPVDVENRLFCEQPYAKRHWSHDTANRL